ncbi:MAG: FAD-dependent oxidoreductase [Pseudomonadota bacterium]
MSARVLIVGAGIVGLSAAYWLTKNGVQVTIVEQGAIPNPVASSADHHRLIRFPYGEAEGYAQRISQAFAAWRTLWSDLPGEESFYYAATGMLAASQRAGDYTDRSVAVMDRLGIPYERIEAEDLATRFPFLEPSNIGYATLSEGGALMANRILAALADWLRRSGVQVLEQAPVEAVETADGTVRLADGRVLGADRVIVTAGISTGRLLPEFAQRLVPFRTVIVYATPPEDLAGIYAGAPCWTDLGGDTDLWGMPAIDGLPMKLGDGQLGRRDPEAADRAMTAEEVRRVLSDYALRFRGAERFTVRWHQANYWTEAHEGAFLLEERDRVLAVSACSGHGFKFGALSGRDVADAADGSVPVETVARRMAGDVQAIREEAAA